MLPSFFFLKQLRPLEIREFNSDFRFFGIAQPNQTKTFFSRGTSGISRSSYLKQLTPVFDGCCFRNRLLYQAPLIKSFFKLHVHSQGETANRNASCMLLNKRRATPTPHILFLGPPCLYLQIADFGFSRFLTNLQHEEPAGEENLHLTCCMSTPRYASPEQRKEGGGYNQQTGIFSNGVMLFELLYPFRWGFLTSSIGGAQTGLCNAKGGQLHSKPAWLYLKSKVRLRVYH